MEFYKFRSLAVTGPLVALATMLMASLSVAASVFDSTGRAQHRIAQAWARMLLAITRVRVEVEGLEKIAPEGSYLFVSNHQSYMDIPVILSNISAQFRFMANWYLFRIPFLGHHLKRAGHLPVNNSNPRESLKMMSAAARVIREREVSVLVFPEGERSYNGLGEFKDGAAFIAIRAGVPVVPVAIDGLREVLPRGGMFLKGGTVRMKVGDPIPTVRLQIQDRQRLTAEMREAVKQLLGHQESAPAEPPAAGEMVRVAS
jgi:1-acyl-sn-glycerol-3-phosphate acyltransferase